MALLKNAQKIPSGVWALGFVSLFMDASSELVHSLLPALFVSLGISMAAVGFIEGVAEATASITKVFSGALSDWLGKRKILAVIGYGLAAITKPLFPLAQSVEVLFAARFIDRIGKGIRGAPRDALIADITPPAIRGAAYGLRQSMDAAGAFIGPLLAIALMALLSDDIPLVLWFALIPAALCMAFLLFGVEEPDAVPAGRDKRGLPLRRADFAQMSGRYWLIVVIGGLFAMARFSVAFLALRAMDLGLPVGLSPFVLVLMMVVFSASSYPVGVLADRMDRGVLLALGFVALILAELVLAGASGYAVAMIGVAIWGVHLGLTQGLLSALVADAAPDHLRGTAFGIFNLVNGIALLFASLVAGAAWQMLGASMAFYTGAAFAGAALLLLLVSLRSRHWA
ncbi:multidrug resistance protein D [bacterium BMS3Bbin10]|nr:multidrug resistance protein D [bacterium BMS3Bbin10]